MADHITPCSQGPTKVEDLPEVVPVLLDEGGLQAPRGLAVFVNSGGGSIS